MKEPPRSSNRRIFKYSLAMSDHGDLKEIQMPYGAEVLCVQVQHGAVQLWASVNTTAPTVPRYFAVYGTGHPMFVAPQTYIGTVQLFGGDILVHVFEVTA